MVVDVFAQLIPWLQTLSGPLLYLGILFVSFIGSATIVLPVVPAVLVIFAVAPIANPWLVGIAAGVGAAFGELTGYALGRGGNYVAGKKQKKYFLQAERLMERYGAVVVIFVFSILPLPFDVIGIICGITRYDIRKFMVATTAGKIIKFTLISLAGFYGISWLMGTFA